LQGTASHHKPFFNGQYSRRVEVFKRDILGRLFEDLAKIGKDSFVLREYPHEIWVILVPGVQE